MIDLYFLTAAVNSQNFNLLAELVMSTGVTTNEANSEIGTQSLTAEIKIKCSR